MSLRQSGDMHAGHQPLHSTHREAIIFIFVPEKLQSLIVAAAANDVVEGLCAAKLVVTSYRLFNKAGIPLASWSSHIDLLR